MDGGGKPVRNTTGNFTTCRRNCPSNSIPDVFGNF